MNKTVTINISGIIFHIEEDAYEKLGKYLLTIRGYFKDSEGRDEIMADIEARIAEMLQERVSQSKQVVLMTDVDHVISVMGQPEEFAGEAAHDDDKKDKEEEQRQETFTGSRHRRLYRDPDEGVFGGVCTGLGYYFGIDPVWIRGAFCISFFIFGTGLLFYILLLIIIPKAQTTAEKLEMRGEHVNVNNIRRTVEEEFENLKRKMNNLGNNAGSYGRETRERWRNEHRFGDAIGDFFRGVFRVFGNLIAALMVLIGISCLIGLLTSAFGMTSFSSETFGYVTQSIFPSHMFGWAVTAGLLFFGVPCIMMIYKGIKILLKVKYHNRIIGFVALGLWICGLFMGIWVITSVASEFSESGEASNTFVLQDPRMEMLTVKVNIDPTMAVSGAGYHGNGNWRYRERNWHLWRVSGDTVRLGYPNLHIEEADGDSFEVYVTRSSQGPDRKTAFENARRIHYNISQKDSVLELNSCFELRSSDLYRAQQVDIILRVPKNKVVKLHKSTIDILDNVPNVTNTWDGDMAGRRWIMTAKGLACIDCEGLELPDNYQPEKMPVREADPSSAGKPGKKDSLGKK